MLEVAGRYKLRAARGDKLDDARIGYYRGDSLPIAVGAFFAGLAGVAGYVVLHTAIIGATGALSLVGVGIGFVAGAAIGAIAGYASQPKPGQDKEDVAPLKYGHLGNCGEWARALRLSMKCAGLKNARWVAADNNPGKDFSEKHSGTYTTTILTDGPDPNLERPNSWEFFDAFMALTDKTQRWDGLPVDKWINNPAFRDKKKFIKDSDGNARAWRCGSCNTINGWNARNCIKCQAMSPLPPSPPLAR
jgi:hypothetical protein